MSQKKQWKWKADIPPALGRARLACHFPSLADHRLQRHQGASDCMTEGNSLQTAQQLRQSFQNHHDTHWVAQPCKNPSPALLQTRTLEDLKICERSETGQVAKLRPGFWPTQEYVGRGHPKAELGSILLPIHRGLKSLEMSSGYHLVPILSSRGNGDIL